MAGEPSERTKLDPKLLIQAYASGYFPMPHPDTEEICWFHPDPRAIIPLEEFHCSRSLRRSIKRNGFRYTINTAFRQVMEGCAKRSDTWINHEFFRAYGILHDLGFCHSLEVWTAGNKLAGGLYGVSLGGAFFAESKFHVITDASKAALFFLVEHMRQVEMELLEVQFLTPHLSSLGAIEIPAAQYEEKLRLAIASTACFS